MEQDYLLPKLVMHGGSRRSAASCQKRLGSLVFLVSGGGNDDDNGWIMLNAYALMKTLVTILCIIASNNHSN